ncbi:MAG: histidine phosphatase family protein [Planctomycetes bacterium]|nr:histidine phosphatase family protein [Planctomycetota bacterium]
MLPSSPMKKGPAVLLLAAVAMLSGSRACTEDAAAPEAAPVFKLFVVRHCEAWKNVDPPPGTPKEKLDSLTEKGLAQAEALSAALKEKAIAAVVTSPTGRTKQTAEPIGKAAGLEPPFTEDAALAPVSGEVSYADTIKRAKALVQALAAKYPGKAAVVVTHGDIAPALLGEAKGTELDKRADKHEVPTGSYSEIEIAGETWTLKLQGVMPAPKPKGEDKTQEKEQEQKKGE